MNLKKSDIDDRHRLDEQTEEMLKQLSVPTSGRTKEDAWQSICNRIETQPQTTVHRKLSIAKIWAAAASIVVLFAIGTLVLTHTTHVSIAKGEHGQVILPDGSSVQLNSESQISYQKYLWWAKREVNLKGEGFFKVMKGRRFEVRTGKYVTSVLGTSFNVFARNDQLRVCCFTGKVAVSEASRRDQKAILTPGMGVTTSADGIGSIEKITEEQKGWTKGEFYFSDAPLSDVLSEIERQFNVKISCTSCNDRRYSGFFSNKSLTQALELVCVPMQLQYSVSANGEVQIY